MTLLPWEYLFQSFSASHFHDLFYPVALGSLVLLIALCVLYAVRTRQLRHHPPYLDLYEWLLWTGIITFGLLLIFSVFVWDFIFVLVTIVAGLRDLRLDPLLPLPAAARDVRAEARPPALPEPPEIRPPRGNDPVQDRPGRPGSRARRPTKRTRKRR